MYNLRQNPTGNRASSVFNGQKPCTRITLSILLLTLQLRAIAPMATEGTEFLF